MWNLWNYEQESLGNDNGTQCFDLRFIAIYWGFEVSDHLKIRGYRILIEDYKIIGIELVITTWIFQKNIKK